MHAIFIFSKSRSNAPCFIAVISRRAGIRWRMRRIFTLTSDTTYGHAVYIRFQRFSIYKQIPAAAASRISCIILPAALPRRHFKSAS